MNEFNPTIFWSWNNLIEADEAKRQIFLFAEQGIKGVFIHARDGLRTPYMGEEWFSCVDAVIEAAKESGVDVWLYDEDGWPSGHAGGRVAANGKAFQMKKLCTATDLSGIPAENIVAAYVKEGEKYRLTENFDEANFFVYYQIANKDKADLMYEKSGEKFLECTHEVYKERYGSYFGNVIKGVFFDESGLGFQWPEYPFYWSESIPEEYARTYGDDIKKDLWRLYTGEEINLFTERFVTVSTALFRKNFILKIQKWCEENNLRMTGHFCMEEALHTSARMTGSVMELYADYDISGIDFLGRRKTSPVLTHQLTSVINQYGKTDALCEALGCIGWDASFNQLFWTWKQIGLYGINIPCIHLSAYSIEGNAKFDHPMFFSYQESRWEKTNALLKAMERFTNFNGTGKSVNDILVISPVYSLYPIPCRGEISRRITNGFRQLSEELDAGQFLYDYGDERLMAKDARVENGKLCVGKMQYSFVIVPQCLSLKRSTFELLKEFAVQGGKILFIEEFPLYIDWEKSDEIAEFARTYYRCVEEGVLTFAKRKLLKQSLYYYGYRHLVSLTDRVDEAFDEEILLNLRKTEKGLHITAFNCSTTSAKKLRLKVNGYRSIVEKDLVSDTEEALFCESADCQVWCDIEIPPTSQGCFIAKAEASSGRKQKLVSVKRLPFENVTVGENYATVDRATLKSGSSVERDFTGKLCYEANGQEVEVEYAFFIKEKLPKLTALLETRNAVAVTLNGADISERLCGWKIDKCLLEYDICDLARKGENVLSVVYSAEEVAKKSGERVQAAYLVGEFDCSFEGYEKHSNFIRTRGEFSLVKRREGYDQTRDLTVQGLWFYRGTAIYRTTVEKQSGRAYLKFDGLNGGAAEILVNGKHAYDVVDFYAEYEISDYLTEENNAVEIVLYSTNRNLLGPHHHTLGKPAMVGFQSFMGKKCFSDHILYGHLDENEIYEKNLSFTEFYIDKIFLIVKEAEQ